MSVTCLLELGELIQVSRGYLNLFSKAKAAKLVRELVDQFLSMDASTGMEVGRSIDIVFEAVFIINLHSYVNVHVG